MVTKKYITRGKSASSIGTQEEKGTESIPALCLPVPTPQIEDTPGCPSVPTPCTPSKTGLLGEVFNRRRSTPTSHGRNLSQSTPAPTNLSPSPPTIDLLDNINTQTLNKLLENPDLTFSQDTQKTIVSMPTTPVGISLTESFTTTTPLQTIAEKETVPLQTVTPIFLAEVDAVPVASVALPGTEANTAKTPSEVGGLQGDATSQTVQYPPTQSPLKRKSTKSRGKTDKTEKRERKRLKKEKQKKLDEIAHDQLTMSQQLIDIDLKLEALCCAYTKVNMTGFMDNIVEKIKEIRSVSSPSKAHPSKPSKRSQSSQCNLSLSENAENIDCNTLPPPPPDMCEEEEDSMELKRIILAQQNTIDLLNAEIDDKDSHIASLSSAAKLRQPTIESAHIAQLEEALVSYKALCDQKDSIISDYMMKSTEWDLFAAKKGNELQYAQEEIFSLKNQLQKQTDNISTVQNENLALKRESHNLRHQLEQHSTKAVSPYSQKGHKHQPTHNARDLNAISHKPGEGEDLVFIHDSIGKGITPGIMSKYDLKTVKVLAYTQEQARESIRNITGMPKAVVLHVGTNDIKNNIDADRIISNYEDLIKLIHKKLPDTKVVLSNILPREDNHLFQRNVEYVNAAVNRKFADSDYVVLIRNNDIGPKLKKSDGVHLLDPGTSRLASHIRDSVLVALKMEK